jgi:hypothetical protein
LADGPAHILDAAHGCECVHYGTKIKPQYAIPLAIIAGWS